MSCFRRIFPMMAGLTLGALGVAQPAHAQPDDLDAALEGRGQVRGQAYTDRAARNEGRNGRRADDYGSGYDDHRAGEVVHCRARGQNRRACAVPRDWRDVRYDVTYIDRRGRHRQCRRDTDWGITSRGVWVTNGCDATVTVVLNNRVARSYRKGDGQRVHAPSRSKSGNVAFITCESRSGRSQHCGLGGSVKGVTLVNRRSKASCRNGRDWGVSRRGIWVANGCRATFAYAVQGQRYSHRSY